jgi:predicted O-methyltransferase YrrM
MQIKSLMVNMLREFRYRLDSLRIPSAVGVVNNSDIQASDESDISELLPLIFSFAMVKAPKFILELGTRGGESTRALVKVAETLQVKGYSVDLSPCPTWLSQSKNWSHFVFDDVSFARVLSETKFWPNGEKFEGLDLIFLDTSHEYEHTKLELEAFWPLLNTKGIIMFHDSNLKLTLTRNLRGKPNRGWNNNRGVIRAIEEYFMYQVDENQYRVIHPFPYSTFALNIPWNNGLFILQKSG